MKKSSYQLVLLGMVIGAVGLLPAWHVFADSTSDVQTGINEGISAAIAAGIPMSGVGLLLSGIRFMGKRINEANDPNNKNVTPFQMHLFLVTGAIGFVAGVVLNVLHISPDTAGQISVILTYFITQFAPAFKNISWTGSKVKKVDGPAKS